MDCTCPKNQQKIPSQDRVYILAPVGSARASEGKMVDAIYDRNCPVHGYTVISETIVTEPKDE